MDNVIITGSREDAELRMNLSESQEWTELISATYPWGRKYHAMVSVYGTNQVLLFGGERSSAGRLNDTWAFNIKNQTWLQKMPINKPGGRFYHAMASVYGDDKVVLFGGNYGDGTGVNWNDTWVYDLSDNDWTKKEPMNHPGGRHWHAMATIYGDDKVVLFGGTYGNDNYYNDIWIYDVSDATWTEKLPTNKPDARNLHAMATIYGTDKVVLFGGNNVKYLNDTWIYDISDNSWKAQTIFHTPAARSAHAMVAVYGTDEIVLFGGNDGTSQYQKNFYNDTWIYDLSDNLWTEKIINSEPCARSGHGMASGGSNNKVILFGGNNKVTNNLGLNDTWIFNPYLSFMNGTYISPTYDIGSNSSIKNFYWDALTTSETSIKFQLRSSANDSELYMKSFLGPDGTNSTYYTTSPAKTWPGHLEERWVQCKVFFSTTNINETPILNYIKLVYNQWPTTSLVDPENDSILTNNYPLFDWRFTDTDSIQQAAFQLIIDDQMDFLNVDYDTGEQNSTENTWQFPTATSFEYIPNGLWYWKVRTKDNDGDWGKYSPPLRFKIDTKAPSSIISMPMNGGFYNNLRNITGFANNSINGVGSNEICKVEIAIKRLKDNVYWDGHEWRDSDKNWLLTSGTTEWYYNSNSVHWVSGYQYEVQSRVTDHAANVEMPKTGIMFTYDADSVIFSNAFPLASEISKIVTVDVGITISDTASGVNASSIEYTVSFNGGIKWYPWLALKSLKNSKSVNVSHNLIFPNGTENRIKWRATDISGNGPVESEPYTVNVSTYLQKFLPKVTLLAPMNGSMVSENTIELRWELLTKDMEDITYNIILDTAYPPNEIIREKHNTTNLVIGDLLDEETYYWTIIPKNRTEDGICHQGVWSFIVNTSFPMPHVRLKYPFDKLTINTLNPTLNWSVEYDGQELVTYDLYLDTFVYPKLIVEGYGDTDYSLDEALENRQTYYWWIVPKVGNLIGQESQIWSFTVDLDYQPMDDLELTFSLSSLELMPGSETSFKITIMNRGKLKDKVSIYLRSPPDLNGLIDISPNPCAGEIAPEKAVEFNFTISVSPDIENAEIILSVEVISMRAIEYGLEFDKSVPLKIRFLENSITPQIETQDNNDFQLICLLLIIIIICVIPISVKVERENVFRNILRKVIFKTIKENPGIHFRQIMRELSLKPGTLSYHLNILEKKRFIKSIQKGLYRCFYLADAKSDLRIVFSELQQNILHTINENPGITLTELSNAVGKNKMVLNYHTHKLEDAGMIIKEKNGKIVSYSATPLATYYIG